MSVHRAPCRTCSDDFDCVDAVYAQFRAQPRLVWALALSVPLVSQGSSVSVSIKVMLTPSLKNWHYNRTKMPNVCIKFFKKL